MLCENSTMCFLCAFTAISIIKINLLLLFVFFLKKIFWFFSFSLFHSITWMIIKIFEFSIRWDDLKWSISSTLSIYFILNSIDHYSIYSVLIKKKKDELMLPLRSAFSLTLVLQLHENQMDPRTWSIYSHNYIFHWSNNASLQMWKKAMAKHSQSAALPAVIATIYTAAVDVVPLIISI